MLKKLIFASIVIFTLLSSCNKEEVVIKRALVQINTYDAISGESLDCEGFEYFNSDKNTLIPFTDPTEIHRSSFFTKSSSIRDGQFKKEDYFPLIAHNFTSTDCDFNSFEVPMKKVSKLKVHITSDQPIENYVVEIHDKLGLSKWVTDRTYTCENLFYSTEILDVVTVSTHESYVYLPSLPDEDMSASFIYSFGPGKGGGQIRKEFKTDPSDVFEVDFHFEDMH